MVKGLCCMNTPYNGAGNVSSYGERQLARCVLAWCAGGVIGVPIRIILWISIVSLLVAIIPSVAVPLSGPCLCRSTGTISNLRTLSCTGYGWAPSAEVAHGLSAAQGGQLGPGDGVPLCSLPVAVARAGSSLRHSAACSVPAEPQPPPL